MGFVFYSSLMRSQVAQRTADNDAGEELLSTGETAALLGVSRQHVVDLCKSGALPYSLVGTHRRIRRADAELFAAGGRRLSRDQARSLFLACAVAGRIVTDPDRAKRIARGNLEKLQQSQARGSTKVWAREWERLLDGPLTDLLTELTSPSPRSRDLRQNNPFAGLLSDEDRAGVLATATRVNH